MAFSRQLLKFVFVASLYLHLSAQAAGLTTVAYGGDFGANLASSFRSGVLNMAMADVQQIIGSRYNDANGKPIRGGEGSLGHVFEHSLAGCFFGELLGSGCQAGALAGAGQAIYAGYLNLHGGSKTADEITNANAQFVSGLAASLCQPHSPRR